MNPEAVQMSAKAQSMASSLSPTSTTQRWLQRGAQSAAALTGLYYGYDIGSRISGIGMGVVMALNAAVCAWLLAAALTDGLLRWRGRG